jgi:hypothetical protein
LTEQELLVLDAAAGTLIEEEAASSQEMGITP